VRPLVQVEVPADGIDQSAQGIAAIEERGRSLENLHSLHGGGIDYLTVVARSIGERSGRKPVLGDEDPVSVKPADDRPGRTRPKAALGHAGLILEHLAQRSARAGGQLQASQRGDRAKGLGHGLRASAGGDGDRLAEGRKLQGNVHRRRLARRDLYLALLGAERAIQVNEELVAPWRHTLEVVDTLIVGLGGSPGRAQRDDGAVQRSPVRRERDRTPNRASGLSVAPNREQERH